MKFLRESIFKKQIYQIQCTNEMKERGAFLGGLGCGVAAGAGVHKFLKRFNKDKVDSQIK